MDVRDVVEWAIRSTASEIEVRDTGPGIPAGVLLRIFEPFFTTKEYGVGTGLGLSISKGIVTSMGGRLEVKTEVGQGSSFSVVLPPAPEATQRQVEPNGRRDEAQALMGRLLVIDDDDLVRKGLARVLAQHRLVCLDNAKDALGVLESDKAFDVILCDLMMPGLTGMDFYEKLLLSDPALAERIVFLSGGAVTSKVGTFLATVSNERVEKPLDVAGLRSTVQRRRAARKTN